jgi:hypothetical protein
MHGDVDDPSKQHKLLVILLEPLFEFQILVPERMCEKVEADAACSALE